MNNSAPVTVPDVVGTYASKIRGHLTSADGPQTVPEICAALNLSERIVRGGLDRLLFCREVCVSYRHEPHRRGAMPRQYVIAAHQ